jgi:pimeloyl-ACP methyl ester carboxylesterase
VEVPTLVLWADKDVALGVGLLRGIEEVVQRAEVHVLENCSHWVQQDKCVQVIFSV